jgi:hypothetical protein
MAIPIKATPVLRGKNALRFLRQVESNAKKDHSVSFERAKATYDRIEAKIRLTSHGQLSLG